MYIIITSVLFLFHYSISNHNSVVRGLWLPADQKKITRIKLTKDNYIKATQPKDTDTNELSSEKTIKIIYSLHRATSSSCKSRGKVVQLENGMEGHFTNNAFIFF